MYSDGWTFSSPLAALAMRYSGLDPPLEPMATFASALANESNLPRLARVALIVIFSGCRDANIRFHSSTALIMMSASFSKRGEAFRNVLASDLKQECVNNVPNPLIALISPVDSACPRGVLNVGNIR